MKKIVLFLFAILFVPSSVVAQDDWREELSSDQIIERDSMYVFEEYGIVKVAFAGNEPAEFQVKFSSEAPADGTISRDNFMGISAAHSIVLLLLVTSQSYEATMSEFLNAFDYTELDAPIGTPDYEINLRMTSEGMQTEFVNTVTDETFRIVETWEEYYEN